MPRYVALLRAVNVGGTGKLPMTELKAMCGDEGFADVETYIASGNVVFSSKLGAAKVKDNVALYLVPSMDHCAGGEGAFAADWLGALERWDASGKPPASIAGAHPPAPPGAPGGATKAFTRPICAYPQLPKYKGSGDEAEAASWQCAAE